MRFENMRGLIVNGKARPTPKWMNNRNWEHTYVLLNKANCTTVFEARVYCTASGATVGCRVWIHSDSVYGYGVGKAGGYGYDRISAAVVNACEDMGIEVEQADREAGFAGGCGMASVMPVLRKALEQVLGMELVEKQFYGD